MAAASCGHDIQRGSCLFTDFKVVDRFPDVNPGRKNLCFCTKKRSYHNRPSYYKYNLLYYVTVVFLILLSTAQTLSASRLRESSSDWGADDGDDGEEDSSYLSDTANDFETCMHGDYLKGYTVTNGYNAGKFSNLGEVRTIEECAELCCQSRGCNIAIMLNDPSSKRKRNCFRVDCYKPGTLSCKPRSARRSKFHPHLFRRGFQMHKPVKVATSEEGSHSIVSNDTILDKDLPSLKRDKRGKSSCHDYTGNACSGSIDQSKLYYYTSSNDTVLDERLRKPIDQISARLSGKCHQIALQAICYRFYPQCRDPLYPKPIKICENECEKLTYGECAAEFAQANMLLYLKRVIPNCGSRDDDDEEEEDQSTISDDSYSCVELRAALPTLGPSNTPSAAAKTSHKLTLKSTDASSSSKSTATVVLSSLNNTEDGSAELSVESTALLKNESVPTGSISKKAETTDSSTPSHGMDGSDYSKTDKTPTATIVDVKDALDGIGLEELETKTTTIPPLVAPTELETKTTTIPPLVAPKVDADKEIRVSAGDNTEITLPENQVSLYASTWPKEERSGDYSYKWSQITAPTDSHGYIEGKTSKNVKLTSLDVPGVYNFQLDVLSSDGSHGTGFVNITVKERTHINHPPRAEVYPKEQTITLPTNIVVLDGSKSSDDDKIVSYKWEELKGPIKENAVFNSNTVSKILQLKNLVSGVYHFRLTVTDSNGETDSTETVVTVKEEKDYPPKANAGNDVLIRLPNDSVVLNGNKSADDKGITTYEWSKAPESPRCDMQGTDKPQLVLSHLTEGTYVFILKVTDSSHQSNEVKVKVIVLPEQNTNPIAVAGHDKELLYPDDSTTLDGSASTDNSKIVSYLWEQESGPTKMKMVGVTRRKVHISDLTAGTYVVKLTVTDDKKLTGTDTVSVHVKKGHNEGPTAVAGKDQVIFLPSRSVVLDGSQSHDDEIIDSFHWTRSGLSPAAGDVINHSDHQVVLRLANLVKGRYIFDLTVTDNKGLTGTDKVTVVVKEDPKSLSLVEMYLDVDIDEFTEENKKQLIRKISVLLDVGKEYVVVLEVSRVIYGKGVMLLFYVNDPNMERRLDGKYVADLIKHKVGFGGKRFDYTMQRVDPYICRNKCSNHGHCDKSTKQCVCDTFWIANVVKEHFGEKESNCEWSILYLSVAVFGVFILFVGVAWSVCYCFARKKRNKRRARYRALRSTDPDGAEDEILLIPKGMKEKFTANSLTFTESDEDSDDENTVFDKKRLFNGSALSNGTTNGKLPKFRDHAM